jgi:UDP-N-acetylglucosamine--N-acetylmuramyl-(pentapeptide) pyrophosphoryl-undecaprenol N-acetylglucosamine transferase
MERDLVLRENVPFKSIPAAGLHGVGLLRLPVNLFKLAQGLFASHKVLREFKPDVLLFTGGYLAVPMALMGRKLPSLVFVPDIEPGLALKFLFRYAKKIAVSVDSALAFLPKSTPAEVTGYPIRADLTRWDKASGRALLKLENDLPVLGIFGGSRGARSINKAVLECIHQLLEWAQVVHITGKLDWKEVSNAKHQLSPTLAQRYHVYPYLHEEMGAALAAANLIVSRSGASTLGELPLFGSPAVLIPYPYAWRYQKVNAQYLADRGAAVILKDEQVAEALLPTIKELLSDPERLNKMSSEMKTLAQPDAAQRIAQILLDLGAGSSRKEPMHD